MNGMEQQQHRARVADFFARERTRLLLHVRSMIDDASDRDGEDIVQDVMLGILNRGGTGVDDLAGYVYRALKNRVIDIWRKKRPVTIPLEGPRADGRSLAGILAASDESAQGRLEREERIRRFEQVFAGLSVAERVLITATEFEGRSFKECASAWGEPLGTLLARKKRALDKLRGSINDEKTKGASHDEI